jgi:hypothetical protein
MGHQTIGAFSPSTPLSGGNNGLIVTQNSNSDTSITGTGLMDDLRVAVLYPAYSPNPTLKWTGMTANTSQDGTTCTAQVTEILLNTGQKRRTVGDDLTTVSVTVGDATTTVDIFTGVPPP